MTKVYNRSDMLRRRRQLRRDATPQEDIMYEALRGRKVAGAKFRFNASIGHYVADFYCPRYSLVVEIDGNQHYTPQGLAYDKVRTAYMESLGIEVIRFRNREVETDLPGVLARIAAVIARRPVRGPG